MRSAHLRSLRLLATTAPGQPARRYRRVPAPTCVPLSPWVSVMLLSVGSGLLVAVRGSWRRYVRLDLGQLRAVLLIAAQQVMPEAGQAARRWQVAQAMRLLDRCVARDRVGLRSVAGRRRHVHLADRLSALPLDEAAELVRWVAEAEVQRLARALARRQVRS